MAFVAVLHKDALFRADFQGFPRAFWDATGQLVLISAARPVQLFTWASSFFSGV